MAEKQNNSLPSLFKTIDFFVAFFIFALVNINSLVRFRQFPEVDNYSDHEGDYIIVAALTIILIVLLLWKERLFPEFVAAWQKNKLLVAFLIYALLSLAWTVYFPATLYKLLFLFFSSIAASYLAIRYRTGGILNILTWVGALGAILSIFMIISFPLIGVMQNPPFVGSWVGIFWHRNHTGNIFAFFNMVFLLRIVLDESISRVRRIMLVLFYLLSASIVIGSHSATGFIVFLFLHFLVALIFAWLRLHQRLRRWHYFSAAGALLAGFLFFITNMAFFFGLLGRTAQMTGRIPLWRDLFKIAYLERPVLGYGYAALWMQKSFRIFMQIRQGWPFQVYFADNGFFDILLNLGLIGFGLFLAIYLPLGVRSLKQAISHKTWLHFFPFLTFLYIFIGNLTYSFLLEVDQMVWLLLVTMVFLTTPTSNDKSPQP